MKNFVWKAFNGKCINKNESIHWWVFCKRGAPEQGVQKTAVKIHAKYL